MSLEESDAKFPGQEGSGIPPSPSRENPGQVYPKSDPKGASGGSVPGTGSSHAVHSILGNPFLLEGAFEKLDRSLTEVIEVIEKEVTSVGESREEVALLKKFVGWRNELDGFRASGIAVAKGGEELDTAAQQGGMFVD